MEKRKIDHRQDGEYLANRNTAPEANEGERQLRDRQNTVQRGVGLANISSGIYLHTDNEHSYNQAAAQWKEIGEVSNQIRRREEMQALMRTTFKVREDKDGKREGTILDGLPDLEMDHMLRSGADSQILIDGKITVVKGPDEWKRMTSILRRLEKTQSIIDIDSDNLREVAKRFRGQSSYVIPYGMTYMLDRSVIGQDIRWLSSPLRIGNPNDPSAAKVSPEREKIFSAYRDMLIHIKNNLTTPAAEHQYVTSYGNDEGNRECLEKVCRDHNAVKGAGKFALLLAVTALLALWAIKDIKKGTISFGTLLLIGAAMFLAQSGPKNAFMGSKQFADLSRRIGREGMEKLQTMRPSARNHLIATLKDRSGRGGITEENLHLLTEPKTKNGRSISSKRVDEDIARMFIGDPHPAGSAYVLERINGVRDAQGKEIMNSLADANHKSDKANEELTQIRQNLPAHQEETEN